METQQQRVQLCHNCHKLCSIQGKGNKSTCCSACKRRHFKQDPAPAIPTDVIHNNPVFRSLAWAVDLAVVVFCFHHIGIKHWIHPLLIYVDSDSISISPDPLVLIFAKKAAKNIELRSGRRCKGSWSKLKVTLRRCVLQGCGQEMWKSIFSVNRFFQ